MPTDPTTIPGWRWIPGMVDTEGFRVIRVLDGVPSAWIGDCVGARLLPAKRHSPADGPAAREFCAGFWREVHPDPTDPATAGCLLALLGPDVAVTVSARETGPLYRIGYGLDGRRHATIGHDSLGAACIAVAEALGRWPGGAS